MAALSTLLLVGSTALSAGSAIASGRANRRYANDLVKEGDRLADDALERGEETADRYRMDLAQLLGAQRASAAASGVDVDFGSAAAIRSETERFGKIDMAQIRENAMREAMGLRRDARAGARQARGQATAQFAGAFGTVLAGGANAWDLYNNGMAFQGLRARRGVSNYVRRTGNAGFNF